MLLQVNKAGEAFIQCGKGTGFNHVNMHITIIPFL